MQGIFVDEEIIKKELIHSSDQWFQNAIEEWFQNAIEETQEVQTFP